MDLEKPKTSAPNSEQCDLCKLVVQYMQAELSSNSTEAEIEAFLDKVCDYLPGTLKTECEDLVKTYVPEIIKLLDTETPDKICALIRLCPSQEFKAKLLLKLSTVQSGEVCEVCEFALTYLDEMLKDKSIQQWVESQLDKVCGFLPTEFASTCQADIQQYLPFLFDFLAQYTPQQVCSSIGLCQGLDWLPKLIAHTRPLTKLSGAEECEICKDLMAFLNKELKDNQTDQELLNLVLKVCDILPASIQKECVADIQHYFPLVVQVFTELSPDELCTTINICPSQGQVEEVKPQVKLTAKDGDGPLCQFCEEAVQAMDSFLKENATEQEIKQDLDTFCNFLPDPLRNDCINAVAEYVPKIIGKITSETPQEFCTLIRLCGSTAVISKEQSLEGCTLCKFILEELKGFLSGKTFMTEVMDGMDDLCAYLPQELRTPCQDLVTMFEPNLVQLLASKIDPIKICQLVRLCDAAAVPKVAVQPASNTLQFSSEREISEAPALPAPDQKTCTACKFAWYEIQSALDTPFWQKESEKVLLQLCKFVPVPHAICQKLVEDDLPGLINAIRGFRFPIEFCQELQFCDPPQPVNTQLTTITDSECRICKVLVEVADVYLQKEATVEEAETFFMKVCNRVVVKDAENAACVSMVKKYTPVLLQLLSQAINPEQVCKEAKLCPREMSPFQGYDPVLSFRGN